MSMESPLSVAELYEALSHVPNGKAPGPDGFPAELYKQFWPFLGQTFYTVVTQIKESSIVRPTVNHANINLLL